MCFLWCREFIIACYLDELEASECSVCTTQNTWIVFYVRDISTAECKGSVVNNINLIHIVCLWSKIYRLSVMKLYCSHEKQPHGHPCPHISLNFVYRCFGNDSLMWQVLWAGSHIQKVDGGECNRKQKWEKPKVTFLCGLIYLISVFCNSPFYNLGLKFHSRCLVSVLLSCACVFCNVRMC